MAFRPNIDAAAVAALTQTQLEALATEQLARTPMARVSLWPNNRRRDGKNDAQFTGKLQLNTVQLAEVLAKALAEGQTEVECWLDVWHNAPSVGKSGGARPVLSGRARSFVEAPGGTDEQSDSIVSALREALGTK